MSPLVTRIVPARWRERAFSADHRPHAPSMFRIRGLDGAARAALWFAAATSGLVMVEPSPHDALMAALIAAALIAGLRVPAGIGLLAVLITTFVAADAVGSTRALDVAGASGHTLITAYLGAATLFFACVAAVRPEATVPAILSGLVLAAAVASLAGILGYFSLGSGSAELFTVYERAKGTFKDPNVFGAFLVLPILYCTAAMVTGGLAGFWWRAGIIAVLLAGLLLSFSRGAWANFALSAGLFFVLMGTIVPNIAVRTRSLVLALAGLVALAGALAWALSFEDIGRLFAERASLDQPYDVGAEGRFAGQAKALALVIAEPLGIGSTEFLRHHYEEPHNVYLNVFLNAGWVGGFAYLALVAATLWRGLTLVLRPGPAQLLSICVVTAFVGAAVEGLVIDTDHWRHFFMMVGLIWGMAAAERRA